MERDERNEIEDVVHASLGRQLKVTCLLGLLFLVFGFVLGHYVAGQHTRDLAQQWNRQADALREQMNQIEQAHRDLKSQVAEQLVQVQPETQQVVSKPAPKVEDDLAAETRRLARATEDLRQSLITRCIEQTERDKNRLLQELQPYVDRKMAIKAAEVSQAVSRLVEQQIQQLKSLAQNDPGSPSADSRAVSIKSEIAPVSGEANPPHLTSTNPQLLPVPGEANGPEVRESVSLAPLPVIVGGRRPTVAEPSTGAVAGQTFFKTPRKPSLFIPARKAAAAPQNPDQVVR